MNIREKRILKETIIALTPEAVELWKPNKPVAIEKRRQIKHMMTKLGKTKMNIMHNGLAYSLKVMDTEYHVYIRELA